MAAEFTTKVRLVRCPKCWLLLPELPNFEVYRCGGCSTILQAKNRVNGLRSSCSGVNGTAAAQMNAVGNGKEDKASSSTSCNGAVLDSGECSSDQIDEKKNESKYSGECSYDRNIEGDESKFSQGSESSSSSRKGKAHALEEYSSEISHVRDESKSSEGIGIGSSPKAVTSDLGECSSEQDIDREDSKSSDGIASCSSSPMATFHKSREVFSNHNNEKHQTKLIDDEHQNGYCEFASSEIKPSTQITGASLEALEDDESVHSEPNLDVDIVVEIDSDSTTSSRLNLVATRLISSIVSAHMPPREHIASDTAISSPDKQSNEIVDFNMDVDSSAVNPEATREGGVIANMAAEESISSSTLTSSPNEQLSEPHIDVPKSFDHWKSSTTFETTDFHSPRSEFSNAIRDRSNSPTSRSHHAYDGSVSSYDGIGDQYFYNHSMNTFQDANMSPNLDQSEQGYQREKFFAESMRNRESALPNQARRYNNGHATRYRSPGHDQMLPPRIPVYPSRDHARVQRNENMSRMTSLQEDSVGGYGNGHFTNPMQNEFQGNLDYPGYQSDRSVLAAADNMTLRRMIYDLQNQVNSLNIQATRKEQHTPIYQNYKASEELHGLNHPRDPRRSRPARHFSQQQSPYRPLPFSSEAITGRHQDDSPYMHRYPQDRRFSAPLPQPIWSNTNALRSPSPDHASSQWGNGIMSDDLRNNSHEVKTYYKEKQQTPKRHFLPIAGGAPILICYKCFTPLQIPADFLLFERKCHRLQCGACSKVLEFSLHKRTLVRYGMNDNISEVEDNFDPVSCSGDYGYGLSYCQRGSTEAGDHSGNIAPSNSLENTEVYDRNVPYGSSNPSRAKQENVPRGLQSQNKDRNAAAKFMSPRTSSHVLKPNKYSSQLEELPPKSRSPLHRLMGYKSPSQVFKGIALSHSGSQNSVNN